MPGIGAGQTPGGFADGDDVRHDGAAVEEWVFTCWAADGSLGAVSAHRVIDRTAWYWAALVRPGEPLLHVTEWDITVRADPSVLKAHGLWAEHICDAPMQQWTITNECFAIALDDPDDALGQAYGTPTAVAFDLEWYATASPTPHDGGYAQEGVVHGLVELPGERLTVAEIPARRWHRWGDSLGPLALPAAYAHTGLRAPVALPDGSVLDWVLSPDGWRDRAPTR
ncbi:MAG: hypothetical protein M3487_10670 [Actinomycetota bacterium]|nr:hypothetical protein [Actinomycetota bacterium]